MQDLCPLVARTNLTSRGPLSTPPLRGHSVDSTAAESAKLNSMCMLFRCCKYCCLSLVHDGNLLCTQKVLLGFACWFFKLPVAPHGHFLHMKYHLHLAMVERLSLVHCNQ